MGSLYAATSERSMFCVDRFSVSVERRTLDELVHPATEDRENRRRIRDGETGPSNMAWVRDGSGWPHERTL
jgi:hypothetical protein